MTILVSISDIELLKSKLAVLIPEVQSSHRVEAMARGLGWQTNAALRAALQDQVLERTVGDQAFVAYLASRGFPVFPGALKQALAQSRLAERTAIRRVMEHEPALTRFGFGTYRDPRMTAVERQKEFRSVRAQLLSSEGVEEFSRACEFLAYYPSRASINPKAFSYGLKHRAEHFHRDRGRQEYYVSNGALIAAAIHLGFHYRVDGPNAYFNTGQRQDHPVAHTTTLGEQRAAKRPSSSPRNPRKTAWRNLMIAAINAGLDQSLYGLDAGDNRWLGDSAVYRFTFGGLPAIAYVTDAGFDELAIRTAVNPSPQADQWIRAMNAGLETGDAIALGMLERRKGKWLQTSDGRPAFSARRSIMPTIVATEVQPRGYLGSGKMMF